MRVVAPVVRRAGVGEHLVVAGIVAAHAVDTVRDANDQRAAQIADQRGHANVHDVIAETSAVGPAARDCAVAKAGLELADEGVEAKDAQAGEAGVIGIGAMRGSAAGEAARAGSPTGRGRRRSRPSVRRFWPAA